MRPYCPKLRVLLLLLACFVLAVHSKATRPDPDPDPDLDPDHSINSLPWWKRMFHHGSSSGEKSLPGRFTFPADSNSVWYDGAFGTIADEQNGQLHDDKHLRPFVLDLSRWTTKPDRSTEILVQLCRRGWFNYVHKIVDMVVSVRDPALVRSYLDTNRRSLAASTSGDRKVFLRAYTADKKVLLAETEEFKLLHTGSTRKVRLWHSNVAPHISVRRNYLATIEFTEKHLAGQDLSMDLINSHTGLGMPGVREVVRIPSDGSLRVKFRKLLYSGWYNVLVKYRGMFNRGSIFKTAPIYLTVENDMSDVPATSIKFALLPSGKSLEVQFKQLEQAVRISNYAWLKHMTELGYTTANDGLNGNLVCLAVRQNNLSAVKLLLSRNKNELLQGESCDSSALEMAVDKPDILNELLENAILTHSDVENALAAAVEKANQQTVLLLLQIGEADPNTLPRGSLTRVVQMGALEVLSILLTNGLDPHLHDDELFLALNSEEAISFLLRHAKPNEETLNQLVEVAIEECTHVSPDDPQSEKNLALLQRWIDMAVNGDQIVTHAVLHIVKRVASRDMPAVAGLALLRWLQSIYESMVNSAALDQAVLKSAAECKNVEIIRFFISRLQASGDKDSTEYKTLLKYVVEAGDVNSFIEMTSPMTELPEAACMEAVRGGHHHILKRILEQFTFNDMKMTNLAQAAYDSKDEEAIYLLDVASYVAGRHVVGQRKRDLKNGANFFGRKDELERIIKGGTVDELRRFVLKTGFVDGDLLGLSSVECAAKTGSLAKVEYLVQHGANPTALFNAPIIAATKQGNLNMVKYLVRHGADPRCRHDAPLKAAIESDSAEIVKFLMEECGSALLPFQYNHHVHVSNRAGAVAVYLRELNLLPKQKGDQSEAIPPVGLSLGQSPSPLAHEQANEHGALLSAPPATQQRADADDRGDNSLTSDGASAFTVDGKTSGTSQSPYDSVPAGMETRVTEEVKFAKKKPQEVPEYWYL